MSSAPTDPQITRFIQGVGLVRIAYGVLAIARPRFWPAVFRTNAEDIDARAWNAFLGSRDIAIGLHSLAARDPQRQGDAILLNQACEVFDSMVVGQEIRQGRPFGMFTIAAVAFNGVMHAIWIKAHLIRRGG